VEFITADRIEKHLGVRLLGGLTDFNPYPVLRKLPIELRERLIDDVDPAAPSQSLTYENQERPAPQNGVIPLDDLLFGLTRRRHDSK
jgi:hypothetical protein